MDGREHLSAVRARAIVRTSRRESRVHAGRRAGYSLASGVRARLLIATVLVFAACGGEDRRAGTPAVSEDVGGGNATYCAIGALEKPESTAVRRFNRAHRDDGFTARFQTLAGYAADLLTSATPR